MRNLLCKFIAYTASKPFTKIYFNRQLLIYTCDDNVKKMHFLLGWFRTSKLSVVQYSWVFFLLPSKITLRSRAYAPSRVITITTLSWLTNSSRGQTWRSCFEGRKWGGVRWEVLEFLQTNMKISDFLQTWGVFLKMRRRHKQGKFWSSCICLAFPGTVSRFDVLSRDCVRLWLIVCCHRVNSNFNLSHAVDFSARTLRRRFSIKHWNEWLHFCSFNFLGALPANGMRSMWEFVFVSQFLRVFQGKFGFVSFTAEVCIKR